MLWESEDSRVTVTGGFGYNPTISVEKWTAAAASSLAICGLFAAFLTASLS
jgi:hypothetical protein